MNTFKTKDIKISKDSAGFFTATHKYHGILIDSVCYADQGSTTARTQCRRDAVEILNDLKECAD